MTRLSPPSSSSPLLLSLLTLLLGLVAAQCLPPVTATTADNTKLSPNHEPNPTLNQKTLTHNHMITPTVNNLPSKSSRSRMSREIVKGTGGGDIYSTLNTGNCSFLRPGVWNASLVMNSTSEEFYPYTPSMGNLYSLNSSQHTVHFNTTTGDFNWIVGWTTWLVNPPVDQFSSGNVYDGKIPLTTDAVNSSVEVPMVLGMGAVPESAGDNCTPPQDVSALGYDLLTIQLYSLEFTWPSDGTCDTVLVQVIPQQPPRQCYGPLNFFVKFGMLPFTAPVNLTYFNQSETFITWWDDSLSHFGESTTDTSLDTSRSVWDIFGLGIAFVCIALAIGALITLVVVWWKRSAASREGFEQLPQ